MNKNDTTSSLNTLERHRTSLIVLSVFFIGATLLAISFVLLFQDKQENPDSKAYQEKHPNVVLIVMDAFRADRIGAERNGKELTPFLNSLYDESIVFKNAVTACTWTRPSMACIYTSLYMDTHQVYYGQSPIVEDVPFSDVLSEELPNMATYLKEYGYATLAVQTNSQASAEYGYANGFDTYVFLDAPPGEEATTNALSLVSKANSPFFLYVHYMDPHTPYNPPQEYLDLVGYNIDNLSSEEGAIVEDFKEYFWDNINLLIGISNERKFEELSPEAKECVIARYDAEILYCDKQVGRIVTSIRKEHPDTVFIITADHGEHLWDHNYLGHGLTMYDCELRVPLLITGNGIEPNSIERPVSTVGILPTIAGLLGTPRYSGWQGRNLLETDDGTPSAFAYTRGSSLSFDIDVETVVFNDMKFIHDKKKNTEELYAWLEDHSEHHNLVEEMPEKAAQMQNMLLEHRQNNINARRSAYQQKAIDEETIEQMRRLGYIE